MIGQMVLILGLKKKNELNIDKSGFILYLYECAACFIVQSKW